MILLLGDDLLDASKTITSGRAVGVSVLQCKTPELLRHHLVNQDVSCCIIDLQTPGLNFDELLMAIKQREKPPRVIAPPVVKKKKKVKSETWDL